MGENLQDHVMVDAIIATVRDPISMVPQRIGMLQEFLYKVFGTGRKCMYVCMYVYVYVCVCVCMYVCVRACVRTYVRMYVCMYVCMYVFI